MTSTNNSTTETYDAANDIALSVRENRIVTLYPDTSSEFAAIVDELLSRAEGDADCSGSGYSGPEGRGWHEFWGTDGDGDEWRVHVVCPAAGDGVVSRDYSYSQYVLDAGWDFAAIEATAKLGCSEEDARRLAELGCGLTPEGLHAHCLARVQEAKLLRYDITVEHEGHVGTVEATGDADAIAKAEEFIAGGEYDLEEGETITIHYWLTPEGGERDDGHEVTLEG